jgi:transaldolase
VSATDNPLRRLQALGQSVWLDYLRRDLIASGELARLVREDAVTGITSNPAIFEKAIAESADYDEAIAAFPATATAEAIYDRLTLADIAAAADVLRPTFAATGGRDGFVSIEVSPRLADDAEATVAEAQRLWAALERPNVMIKVPATPAGCAAIRRLIAAGVNVNVTLMFSLGHYEAVAEAYIAGLEERRAAGLPVAGVASVASFFVSRVDQKLDPRLAAAGRPDLCGRVAVANAKAAYARFREVFAGERFRRLGAAVQRPLWASTSTKNPAYSDVLYVEELIGPDTVNTMPPQTLAAYRDHGRPEVRVTQGLAEARALLAELPRLGIDLAAAGDELQREGVRLFAEAYDKVLASIARKRQLLAGARP